MHSSSSAILAIRNACAAHRIIAPSFPSRLFSSATFRTKLLLFPPHSSTPSHHHSPLLFFNTHLISQPTRSMAGHSKWAKIARAKGSNDLQRSVLFSKISKAITAAVKAGGGNIDPATNLKLQTALDLGKKNNVPREIIERAIKSKSDAVLETVFYEGTGPAGVSFIIECTTDNRKRTTAVIRSYLTKAGGELAASGSQSWLFTTTGKVVIVKGQSPPLSKHAIAAAAAAGGSATPPKSLSEEEWEEKVLEIGLNAGASDVVYEKGDDDDDDTMKNNNDGDVGGDAAVADPGAGSSQQQQKHTAILTCEKDAVQPLRQAFEAQEKVTPGIFVIESSEVVRVPTTTVTVSPGTDAETNLMYLFEVLANNEDVNGYVHNAAEVEEEGE